MLAPDRVWQRISDPVSGRDEITARLRCVGYGVDYVGDDQTLAFMRLADRYVGDLLCIPIEQFSGCDFWPSLDTTFVLRYTHDPQGGIVILGIGEVNTDAAG